MTGLCNDPNHIKYGCTGSLKDVLLPKPCDHINMVQINSSPRHYKCEDCGLEVKEAERMA